MMQSNILVNALFFMTFGDPTLAFLLPNRTPRNNVIKEQSKGDDCKYRKSVAMQYAPFLQAKAIHLLDTTKLSLSRPSSTTSATTKTTTCLFQSSSSGDYQVYARKRSGITLPLLDLTSPSDDSDYDKKIITPLPASHLPHELSTLNMYGMQLKAAIHKMMIDDVLSKVPVGIGSLDLQEDIFGRDGSINRPIYGHLIQKQDPSSLVGAIGCAAEIIISTPTNTAKIDTVMEDVSLANLGNDSTEDEYSDFEDPLNDGTVEDSSITVLTKGAFRFVVREITQTFPFPIAIVDELLDDNVQSSSSSDMPSSLKNLDSEDEDEDEDEDDEYDMYSNLTTTELMQRTFSAMKTIIDQRLDVKPKTMSPLEISILEESGVSPDAAMGMDTMQQSQAEEMGAIFDIFTSSLIDITPMPTERFFVTAMLAAEFGGLENDLRRKILVTVDGTQRLRVVLEALEQKISLVQAKKLTNDIVEKSDEGSKDLLVGSPTLPAWAKSLKKGTKIEYYWSVQDGWLSGTVQETETIINELIVTVLFGDGETVRLPFDPEEKIRWRPAGM